MQPVLAVDFGTSTSSAALVAGADVWLVQEPGQNSWTWPSAVYLNGERLLVGREAEHMKRLQPMNFRTEFKRVLGQSTPVWLGQRAFAPRDLVAAVLSALRAQALRELRGAALDRLVLTVPASYGEVDPRRTLMIEAGEQAGFADVELLPEPVAAAFAPIAGAPLASGALVLVYDFGGGTFDTAVLRVLPDGTYEVLGCAALEDCGGSDIDAAMYQWLRERFRSKLGGQPADADAISLAMDLNELLREAKHQLTEVPTAPTYFEPLHEQLTLDRAQLEQIITPMLRDTVRCCRDLLASTGVLVEQIAAVLLVGGSSRIPLVSQVLRAELRRPLRLTQDPSVAVVHGAARWAAAGVRTVPPRGLADGARALRWKLPGDTATIVRWLVAPGQNFEPGAPLAVLRLGNGSLWRMLAGHDSGQLVSVHADPGDEVTSADWLVTVRPAVGGRA
ncbi:Hsp70 family protein [Kutzneria viridogrisea]|uniref:WD-40 repeat-containing protein n=2 Tax=Kutzneria TaxID=43356 RepID=W5W4W0_9PSEU|nr:Hsp70 family protein [Kutzneria albida]AHH96263.1 WD-40 repeat-containing protein [Kutzneria albida DSM 43870]MBA8928524.1 molecular chaperone DnaK (HSP70) [Kutzneria viridogrisea]